MTPIDKLFSGETVAVTQAVLDALAAGLGTTCGYCDKPIELGSAVALVRVATLHGDGDRHVHLPRCGPCLVDTTARVVRERFTAALDAAMAAPQPSGVEIPAAKEARAARQRGRRKRVTEAAHAGCFAIDGRLL